MGRAPQMLVDILSALERAVAEHFTVVGTHALYATKWILMPGHWVQWSVIQLPRMSVMGKLGASYMLADVNVKNGAAVTVRGGDDGYEPNYGVGVSYALLDFMSLRAEWERFDRKSHDIDLMSAGIAMKF